MKQLLFLLLFPCLCVAQYTGNAGQKITLGEQTSADGLVYRGNAADTVAATLKITKTNKQDTSAFLLLDTINNVFLKYNIGTTYWTRLNILPTDTASMLGNYWRNNRFSGTLPVANGGTGQNTFTSGYLLFGNGTTNINSSDRLKFNSTSNRLGIGISHAPNVSLELDTALRLNGTGISGRGFNIRHDNASAALVIEYIFGNVFYSNVFAALFTGEVGFGTTTPSQKLQVNGNARITSVGTASSSNTTLYITNDGTLSTNVSDVNKKHNVRSLPYGLNTINQLNPVAFDWNETDETDIGFIAQDIENVIPESIITNWDSQLIFRQEKIIPILVKAIQEQQALIKTLEQRILILENK